MSARGEARESEGRSYTHQEALVAAGDAERAAGVAAAGADCAGAAGAQRGRDNDATERLRAHRVRDHLQRHVALELILRDAGSCKCYGKFYIFFTAASARCDSKIYTYNRKV